jgi:hypothetical protein
MSKERKRDEGGKFEGEVTEQDILRVLDRSEEPVLTASDIADELPVGDKAVYLHLRDMHDDGLVGRKKVGGRAVVWWAKVEPRPETGGEGRDLEEFRGILKTDKSAAELVEEVREADREREERLKNLATDE